MTENSKSYPICFFRSTNALPYSVSYAGHFIDSSMSSSKTDVVYDSRHNIQSYLWNITHAISHDKKQKRMI